MKTHAFLRRTLYTTLLCGLALSQGQVKAAIQAQCYRNSAEYMETVEKVFKPALTALNNVRSLNDLTNLVLPQADVTHQAIVSPRNLNILAARLICARNMPTLVNKVAAACDRILNAFARQDQQLSDDEKRTVTSFKEKLIGFAKYFMVFDDEVNGSISAALTQQTQSHQCYKDAARSCELFEQVIAIVDSFENDITASSNAKAAPEAKAPAQEDEQEEAVVEEEKVEAKAPIHPQEDNKQSVGSAENPAIHGGPSTGQILGTIGAGAAALIAPAVINILTTSTPDTKPEEKTPHVETPKESVDLKQAAEQQAREQLERERLERERLAQIERDRAAQQERERLERERLEREHTAQVERDHAAQQERERLERERLAQVERDRAAQQERERLERERLEREHTAQVERDHAAQQERERLALAAEQKQAKDATEQKQEKVAKAPQFTDAQTTRDYIVSMLPGLPALSIAPTNGSTPNSSATNLHASSSSASSGSASSITTTKQEEPIVPANDQKAIVALEKEATEIYTSIQHPSQLASTQLFDKLIAIAQIYGKHAFTNKRAAHMLGITEMAIDHVRIKFGNPLTESQEATLKAIYPTDTNSWFTRTFTCRRTGTAKLPSAVAAITDPEHLYEIWSCSHVVPSATQTAMIEAQINALDKIADKTKTSEQAEQVALDTFPADFSSYDTFARQVIWNKLMIQAQNVIATRDATREVATRNLLRRALELGAVGEYALIFKEQLDMVGDAPAEDVFTI